MAGVAMMVGGALVNALAFSGSNYLFSMLKDNGVNEERKRHDEAVEQLQKAQEEWGRKRQQRLDWINEELRRQGHAERTFQDVDEAMRQYRLVTGGNTHLEPLEAEPKLTDFYTPTSAQKDREIAFVALGMGITALVTYQLAK